MAAEFIGENTSGGKTVNITSLEALEQETNELASKNQKIANHAKELSSILSQIQSNWDSSEGEDLPSIVEELTKYINNINNAIVPTVTEYVKAMNTIVAETRITQGKTV